MARAQKRYGWKQAIERANLLYERFHQREPDSDYLLNLQWPESCRFGVEDRALRLGYYSNKWNDDGEWESYTHPHNHPLPVLLEPMRPGLKPFGRRFLRPLALTWLGYALDVQLDRPPPNPEYLDFKGMARWPWLAGDPDRNLLVIIDQESLDVQLLWSPILRITERGIEN